MTPELCVADMAGLVARTVADFEAEGRKALASRGMFSVALSGGSVATELFPHLARAPLDWSQVHFFWADERAVAPTDPDSNYRVARETWFTPARVPEGQIHRMPADAPDANGAAAAYAGLLERLTGRPARLDYAILGVGPDGHVASLFPGHPLLQVQGASVAMVEDSPKPPPRRMTLTLPVLRQADRVVVGAFGASKAGVIREALEDPTSKLPVALVLAGARRPLLLLDSPAAALLSKGPKK